MFNKDHGCCGEGDGKCAHGHHHVGVKCALAAFLIILSVFTVYKTRNAAREYGYIGRAPLTQYTITISGEGKVTATPDIANVSMGVQTESKTVKDAQTENNDKMNVIIKAIKDLGVDAKDIKTENYSVYPKYNYNSVNGTSNIVGYTVSQSVSIKIRDLDKVGSILAKGGELGANTVGGVNFTVDNPDKLKSEARQKAIDNAKEKAASLFKNLGVQVGRIVSFDEFGASGVMPMYTDKAYGMGGGAPTAVPAPDIQPGSTEITSNVNLTFEIK
jgi:hypothetical protein